MQRASPVVSRAHRVAAKQAKGDDLIPASPVNLTAQGVYFSIMPGVRIEVREFDAQLNPAHTGVIVSLDDLQSFKIKIRSAETRLKSDELNLLLNNYTLPHAQTRIRDLHISFVGQQIHLDGHLHYGFTVPFHATATVAKTTDGELDAHVIDVVTAGFLHKSLTDLLGIKLSTIASPEFRRSFRIVGDHVIFPTSALFPPPAVAGTLTHVGIDGDTLVQVFGTSKALPYPPPTPAAHYLYFHGGTMQFGKLTMTNVDLELVDGKPTNPFTFSLNHYYQQIVSGYSKSRSDRGLLVVLSDYVDEKKK